jgi:hypothetical protein
LPPAAQFAGTGFICLQVKGEKTLNFAWTPPEVREVNGNTSIIVSGVWYDNGRALPALFRYDVASGGVNLFARSDRSEAYSIQWLLDDSGEVAGDILYFEERKQWELKLRRDGRMQVVASGTAPIDRPSIVGFNPRGDEIWVRFVEDGQIVWKSLSASAGTWGSTLDPDNVFAETIKDRKT